MLIVGMSGSGKTTFARSLLLMVNKRRPIIILDSKPDDSLLLPGSHVITNASDALKWKPDQRPALVYRPDGLDMSQPERLDAFLQWAYDTGDCLVYIDELNALDQGYRPRPGLINLLSRGRSRDRNGRTVHTPLWMSTQRPARIPKQAISEANRIVAFYLGRKEDRKALADDGDATFLDNPSHDYGFRLYDRGQRRTMHFKPLRGVG